MGKFTASWDDYCFFLLPDLDLQVQVHLSVYKLVHCLSYPGRPYKYLNTPKIQVSPSPLLVWVVSLPSSGVSSFLHWWLLHLSHAEASYALCWFKPIKGWSLIGVILFFGGEKNFTTLLALDQSSWLAKKTLPFLTISWAIHLSLGINCDFSLIVREVIDKFMEAKVEWMHHFCSSYLREHTSMKLSWERLILDYVSWLSFGVWRRWSRMLLTEVVVSKIMSYFFASGELQVQNEDGHWLFSCSG